MKQEIVIKVQMKCDKCRTKAMELVASADGVNSLSLGGDEKNQLVVVGDGVDAVSLASILRKKVGPTDIIKVGEPNSKNNAKKDKDKDNGKNPGKKGDGDEKKEKSQDSGKQKEGKKTENGKNVEQQKKHQYQYGYQQQEQKMEYGQVQQQWYQGYPIYPQAQVVLYEYDIDGYAEPSCSIM